MVSQGLLRSSELLRLLTCLLSFMRRNQSGVFFVGVRGRKLSYNGGTPIDGDPAVEDGRATAIWRINTGMIPKEGQETPRGFLVQLNVIFSTSLLEEARNPNAVGLMIPGYLIESLPPVEKADEKVADSVALRMRQIELRRDKGEAERSDSTGETMLHCTSGCDKSPKNMCWE